MNFRNLVNRIWTWNELKNPKEECIFFWGMWMDVLLLALAIELLSLVR